MAFAANGLTRTRAGGTSVANVTTSQFDYATEDAAAVVEGSNYFPGDCGLAKGDAVLAHMVLGGTPVLKQYMVTAVATAGCTIVVQAVTAG
jgi:hypothetical protein